MSTANKPVAVLEADIKRDATSTKTGKKKVPQCTSLTWNALGKKLFAGFSDGIIRVWHIKTEED